MAALPLSFEQMSEDLELIEEHGVDTELLSRLVKESGGSENQGDQSTLFLSSPLTGYPNIIRICLTNAILLFESQKSAKFEK